jgi:hypothetical protein
MLSRRQFIRPTAEQCLKHPWFAADKAIINTLLSVNNDIANTPVPINYR